MNRKETIRVATGVIIVGLGYLGVRSWQRKKLFNEIAEMIGPGAGGSLDQFDEWWNPDFCTNSRCTAPDGRAVIGISENKQMKWANNLYDGAGFFYDDTGTFYGTLREIPDGVALSLVAGKFQRKYKEDLKEYINYHLGDRDEQQKIYQILSQKPAYRISAEQ